MEAQVGGQKLTLTPEQLQQLLGKLSSDEQKSIQEVLKACTTEVTMTRGVPFTAFTLGSLYFARNRLPPQYHFGPRGWPFYAIVGVASFSVANLFGMNKCKERIEPMIAQLWQKYNAEGSSVSYASLRDRNRIGVRDAEKGISDYNSVNPDKVENVIKEDPYAPRLRTKRLYDDPSFQQEAFISGYLLYSLRRGIPDRQLRKTSYIVSYQNPLFSLKLAAF